MSTTAGLSRRRVPGPSPSSPSSDDSSPSSLTARGPSPNGHTPSPSHHAHAHAGSAFEGGSKIAYDPRDLDNDADEEAKVGGKIPRLTIMEEVLLLGIKDKQGYLSFWNDNISYALRGCILIELALRRRIALVCDPNRRRVPLAERLVEVIDTRNTGETLLDESLKLMKAQQDVEKLSVNTWIDLLSGETWNVLKIGFQLKQVRERLAKGLVDKGVLRTEKRNFLLFDMATHPLADVRAKETLLTRVVALLTSSTSAVPKEALDKEGVQCRVLRSVCLVCAAYTGSVLDNAFVASAGRMGYEDREAAFGRCDEILAEFACWPFGTSTSTSSTSSLSTLPAASSGNGESAAQARRRRAAAAVGRIGAGGELSGRDVVMGLVNEVRKEARGGDGSSSGALEDDVGFELIAGVLEVLSKLDSLL